MYRSTHWSHIRDALKCAISIRNYNTKFLIKLIVSNVLVLGIIEIFVVSIWLNILYGKAYLVVVSTRILTQVIMLPIRVITIFFLEKLTRPMVNKYLYDGEANEC